MALYLGSQIVCPSIDYRLAEYSFDQVSSGYAMSLVSHNMTPKASYSNGYVWFETPSYKIGNDVIDPALLVMKPYADGGNLINYTDDGSAVVLDLFALHPDGQSHEMLVNFVRPNLVANGTIGGNDFAVLADSEIDSSRQAWKAFDGDTQMVNVYTDMWHSDYGQPHWLEFYNPNPLLVNSINIFNSMDTVVPWDWEFQYSDDGLAWTTCASGTNTDWTQNSEWSFAVNNSDEHQYYRFYTTTAHGTTPEYTSITEMQIIGVERRNEISNTYKYVLAPDGNFTLPTGFFNKTLVGKLKIPVHNI